MSTTTALDRRTALAFSARRRKRQEPPKTAVQWADGKGIHWWSAQRAQLAHAYQDGGLTVPDELRRFL